MKTTPTLIGCLFVGLLAGCATGQHRNGGASTLKDAYKDDFLIGVAINRSQFLEEDQRGVPIIKSQFNSITPENILKWESVHPQPGQYDFEAPDRYVEFGEKNGMYIIGHTLVWHSQDRRAGCFKMTKENRSRVTSCWNGCATIS